MRLPLFLFALPLAGCAVYNPTFDFTHPDLNDNEQQAQFTADKPECVAAALSVFEENPVFGIYIEPYSGHDGGYYSVRAYKPNPNASMQIAEAKALHEVKTSRDTLYTQCMETRGWVRTSP